VPYPACYSLAGANGASETASAEFGQSMATFRGDTLVIETRGAPPMSLAGVIETTDEATVIERYRPRPDGSRLDILFTIDDAVSALVGLPVLGGQLLAGLVFEGRIGRQDAIRIDIPVEEVERVFGHDVARELERLEIQREALDDV
jgi:hypothetical protein